MASTTYKLIYFAPESDLAPTKEAVFAAGAGGIGNYTHCAWQTRGIGQFKPRDGANPTIGQLDTLETVDEWRVEMIVPREKAKAVVEALKKAHSYEEPAFELIQLVDIDAL